MKKTVLLLTLLFLMTIQIYSQEDSTKTLLEIEKLKGQIEEMNAILSKVKTNVDDLKKLKISGYVQAQFQSAEQKGIKSFAGGNFSSNMHNRFNIRRGRIKFDYKNVFTDFSINQAVFQLDITEKGVGVKDAYLRLNEQWLKAFSVSAGIFDRPFGYEITFSSSSRESPERSRVFQSLFPNERDLGVKLAFLANEQSPLKKLSFVNLNAGIFAGNGINQEQDNFKDFIGRLGFSFPFYEQNMSIDFGFSGYYGNVLLPTNKSLFIVDNKVKAQEKINSSSAKRQYFGADVQFYYDLPLIGGFSLKGEYLTGKQPSTNNANTSFTSLPTGDLYLREFEGYYLMFVQNLGRFNQLLLKYDVYDPNTSVKSDEINENSEARLSSADLKYSTIGLGYIHYWDENLKFVLYYDIVKNETSKYIEQYKSQVKENVFTFRIQYKF